jgi:hypothetical protein
MHVPQPLHRVGFIQLPSMAILPETFLDTSPHMGWRSPATISAV